MGEGRKEGRGGRTQFLKGAFLSPFARSCTSFSFYLTITWKQEPTCLKYIPTSLFGFIGVYLDIHTLLMSHTKNMLRNADVSYSSIAADDRTSDCSCCFCSCRLSVNCKFSCVTSHSTGLSLFTPCTQYY